jgi:hypothetical protein
VVSAPRKLLWVREFAELGGTCRLACKVPVKDDISFWTYVMQVTIFNLRNAHFENAMAVGRWPNHFG